jgi:hypothetical protein
VLRVMYDDAHDRLHARVVVSLSGLVSIAIVPRLALAFAVVVEPVQYIAVSMCSERSELWSLFTCGFKFCSRPSVKVSC